MQINSCLCRDKTHSQIFYCSTICTISVSLCMGKIYQKISILQNTAKLQLFYSITTRNLYSKVVCISETGRLNKSTANNLFNISPSRVWNNHICNKRTSAVVFDKINKHPNKKKDGLLCIRIHRQRAS